MSTPLNGRQRNTLAALLVAMSAACADEPSPVGPRPPEGASSQQASALVVTNTQDAGPGSLREVVAAAVGGDVITFDPSIAGGSIALSTHLNLQGGPLTIDGGNSGMTITTDGFSGPLLFTAGDVTLRSLTLAGAKPHPQFSGAVRNNGTLRLERCTFRENTTFPTGTIFGGAAISNFGVLTAVDCRFTRNHAEIGSVLWNDGAATIIGSTLDSNTTAQAGAIHSFANSQLTVVNSTLSANTSGASAGISSEAPYTLDHTTVTGHLSGVGAAALFSRAPVTVTNSIVGGNVSGPSATPGDCMFLAPAQPRVILGGVNVVSDAACGIPGPNLLIADAQLLALAANGGRNPTHALLRTSPAFNAIPVSGCTQATDQRGVTRPISTGCDAGAYEFDALVSVPLTVNVSTVVHPTTGAATLTGTATCPADFPVQLTATLTQIQKGGRPAVTVRGTNTIPCQGQVNWSMVVSPSAGAFRNTDATVAVVASHPWAQTTSINQALKLYWGHK